MAPVIAEANVESLKGILPNNEDLCTIEATVVTGLEDVAVEECREKLGVHCVVARGRVFLDTPVDQVPEVLKLRSIDNVNVVLKMVKNFSFPEKREDSFARLYKFAEEQDWRKGMRVWRAVLGFPTDPIGEMQPLGEDYCQPRPEVDLKRIKLSSQILSNLPETVVPNHLKEGCQDGGPGNQPQEDTAEEVANKRRDKKREVEAGEEPDVRGPKFRVSCSRTGSKHNFGSSEAARQFGGGVNEMFGWPVNLTKFELEILLCIDTEFVYTAVCLTREPLFRRNLTNFGRTNLRSTICYNMVRLAAPGPGEVVVDPMCGGATIPMEGCLTHPKALHIGGDNFGQAVKRSRDNIDHLVGKGRSMPVDVVHWDCTRLPLRSQTVDVMVSDLPFGKRMGRQVDNRVLYFHSLVEMARVTRVGSGRAVLLTYDKNSMLRNIKRVHTLWKTGASRTINIGGLAAVVYMLHRTSLLTDPSLTTNTPSAHHS